MNELVTKVQSFLAASPKATLEPGAVIAYADAKVRIIADTVGTKKVRIFDAETNEKVFSGTVDSDANDKQDDLIKYLDEVLAGKVEEPQTEELKGKEVSPVVPTVTTPLIANSGAKPAEAPVLPVLNPADEPVKAPQTPEEIQVALFGTPNHVASDSQ